jgi:anaerobic magnesium-protoporphyrin IX monomethyl ester cyclase
MERPVVVRETWNASIMVSILVAHSYFLQFDEKQLKRAKPYPPLATLQVAAALRAAGHEVRMFDAMLASGTQEYADASAAARPQLALFYEDNFNYLSKMCLGRMRRATLEMIAIARGHGAFAVVAGSDATDDPAAYLAAGADIVLLGEGLMALRSIVARVDEGATRTVQLTLGLNGVAFLDEEGRVCIRHAPGAPEQQHPTQPAWDLIDVERYRKTWTRAHGYFSLNMAASRGCSFRCNWCAKPIWGNRYLQRTPLDVATEMAYLKRTLRPDHIWFADDIFGFRADWVGRFAVAVDEIDGALPFTIQTRADLVSEPMADALRRAHCAEVWIGAESGSQRVLDAMNKGTRVAEVLAARELLRARDIRVGFFIQLGYLGEELDDLLATRELIESARPDDIGVSVSYPLPGTKFHELVREQLRAKTHWEESSDLAMMFQGTYTSEFYREIRNLLHDQVTTDTHHAPRSHEHRAASADVRQRWERLLADEVRYRTEGTSRPWDRPAFAASTP